MINSLGFGVLLEASVWYSDTLNKCCAIMCLTVVQIGFCGVCGVCGLSWMDGWVN